MEKIARKLDMAKDLGKIRGAATALEALVAHEIGNVVQRRRDAAAKGHAAIRLVFDEDGFLQEAHIDDHLHVTRQYALKRAKATAS